MSETILSIKGLTVRYKGESGDVTAVESTSFDIGKAEVFGLVGESGCGKSTLGHSIIRLLPANGEVVNGFVRFNGTELLSLSEGQMRRDVRGTKITMITQDPQHALNPVFQVGTQLHDVLKFHSDRGEDTGHLSYSEREQKILEMLEQMGISDTEDRIEEYPHQFSGGMKQRVMLAMAFITNPVLMIADEPTTALDPTIEAQILEILQRNIEQYSTSVLYITHDLGIINKISRRLAVMYAGSIVELGDTTELFDESLHPYTIAMLECLESESEKRGGMKTIPGSVPKLNNLPSGCKFHPRCEERQSKCENKQPDLQAVKPGHQVACWMVREVPS